MIYSFDAEGLIENLENDMQENDVPPFGLTQSRCPTGKNFSSTTSMLPVSIRSAGLGRL